MANWAATELASTGISDRSHLLAALALARRGLGGVWPNPAVGCVIVNEGRVAGRGWTQPGGRPHAETEALARAGESARGATAYVTLEPCAHQGETPPCAPALAAAGIARVVTALEDPDPRVSGRGAALLEGAGITVETGLCGAEAAEVNAGYLTRMEKGRPLFTLKSATSLDGRIATAGGESQWITGEQARAAGHGLRLTHDAVLVGSGTAVADDPMLTCRLPGLDDTFRRVRIVVDGRLRLPETSRLVQTAAHQPLWLATLESQPASATEAFAAAGATVIRVPADRAGHPDLAALARELGNRGLTRVLVEGGAEMAAAFFAADLVDRMAVFRAPLVLGGGGAAQIAPMDIASLGEAPRFERLGFAALGPDLVETYRKKD